MASVQNLIEFLSARNDETDRVRASIEYEGQEAAKAMERAQSSFGKQVAGQQVVGDLRQALECLVKAQASIGMAKESMQELMSTLSY